MRFRKVSHTVTIGGDNGVGKRALVARHCRNEFQDWVCVRLCATTPPIVRS